MSKDLEGLEISQTEIEQLTGVSEVGKTLSEEEYYKLFQEKYNETKDKYLKIFISIWFSVALLIFLLLEFVYNYPEYPRYSTTPQKMVLVILFAILSVAPGSIVGAFMIKFFAGPITKITNEALQVGLRVHETMRPHGKAIFKAAQEKTADIEPLAK